MRVPPAAIYVPEEDRKWILEQIDACLQSGQLTLGKNGKQLEEEFAALCGTKYAVAVNSGTASIEIILRAIGVEGREVIVPTNTFYATGGAVVHAGGKPRFVDCEPGSFAIDADALEKAIGPETAAVVMVHIGGFISPDMPRIKAICDRHNVPLVEDAAHAHGSSLNGQKAGSFGIAGSFSFYPTKVITSAEGGVIVTDDEGLYKEALIYRDQGKEGFTTNFHVRLGYNWRLSEPNAIIGLSQLRRLGQFSEHRRSVAGVYDEMLGRLGERAMPVRQAPGVVSNYYKYMVMLGDADRPSLKKLLREEYDVGLSGEVYDTPLHKQPVFAPWVNGDSLAMAEDICARHVCLPTSAVMTEDDARYVVESLEAALDKLAKN
jgi:dTDP-4-amino-4,6-dideoxygalactose transaminase